MNTKVSPTNTKAQILEAYDELLKKLEEKSEDKPKEVQQRKEDLKTVESAQKNTEDSIIKGISSLKVSFNDALEKILQSLTVEHKKLADIQAAIKIEKQNLENLYGLSANADSFAAILLAQKESREKFEEEIKTARAAFETEMNDSKAKWDKEKADRDEQIKEEKALTLKTRKREEEEYLYALQQKRKKEDDEFELKKAKQESELKEKKIAFEKEYAEREKTIAEKEQEFEALKKAADNFPKELEKDVQEANVALEAKLSAEFKYKTDLSAKDTEGIMQLKNLQIATLENKIKEMDAQSNLLGQKAETAEKSVKDIALKAIESSQKVQYFESEKQGNEK